MRNATEQKSGEIRLGLVQWMVQPFASADALIVRVEQQVASFANYGADFVLYPEYFSLPLLSLFSQHEELEQIKLLAGMAETFQKAFSRIANKYQINIIAGSIPALTPEGDLQNVTYLCHRDGSVDTYAKLHLTPYEKEHWKMLPGNKLGVFETDRGIIGIQTCYDVEFPELSRLYAEKGVKILFVPSSTDSQEGFYRVRHCAQARAIENECYVAMAVCVGYLPEISAIEFQYGESSVFTPSDYAFPLGAVKSTLPPNVESIIVSDVNLALLYDLHQQGSVRNLLDRRTDLYQLNVPEPIQHSSSNGKAHADFHVLGPRS
jgi:predicted amidohydrolase